MSKNLFSSAAVALSLIVSISILSSCGAAIDKLIDKMAVEGNKQCPMHIDSATRLDSIMHSEKSVLEYSYTLIDVSEENLSMDKDQAASISKALIIENLKNTESKELKAILKLKATLRYTYYDKNGALLFSFDVVPDDYVTLL